MDSRERAALNKAVTAAMDAVNARQDELIADLTAKLTALAAKVAKLQHVVDDLKAKKAKE